MSQKKSGLGKGLSALLDNSVSVNEFKEIEVATSNAQITTLPVDRIEANPFQPRSEFKEEELLNLADSIRVHGLIQPITVRKLSADKYQIISGERRFRAAQLVGLTNVPVFIRYFNRYIISIGMCGEKRKPQYAAGIVKYCAKCMSI